MMISQHEVTAYKLWVHSSKAPCADAQALPAHLAHLHLSPQPQLPSEHLQVLVLHAETQATNSSSSSTQISASTLHAAKPCSPCTRSSSKPSAVTSSRGTRQNVHLWLLSCEHMHEQRGVMAWQHYVLANQWCLQRMRSCCRRPRQAQLVHGVCATLCDTPRACRRHVRELACMQCPPAHVAAGCLHPLGLATSA
jgi:hypothetical protein